MNRSMRTQRSSVEAWSSIDHQDKSVSTRKEKGVEALMRDLEPAHKDGVEIADRQ